MDDLTSLKTSLVSEASNFVSLFSSKLEQTESDLETAAILESFWEVLDGETGENQESREFRMTSTLQPSSLDLVPLLSPLLARPSPVKIAAEKLLLEGVGKFSSPREVMVAVGERLEALVEEAGAQEGDMADEDEDGEGEDSEDGESEEVENEEEHDHGHSDPHHHHHHPSSSSHPRYTPPSALASELSTLLALLASSIPRLTSKRSLPTFLNLASMLPAALSSVPPRPSTSRLVLDRLREVVEAARSWGMGTEDWSAKGEQKSILLGILAGGLVHLYPGLDVSSTNSSGWSHGMPNLIRATLRLIPAIDPSSPTPTPQSLLTLLSNTSPSGSTSLPTFALLLLSWELFCSPDPQPHHFFNAIPSPHSPNPSLWLDLSVEQGLLSTAGAGGLGWVRGCVRAIQQQQKKNLPGPSDETIRTIFQTYLAPLASSPAPAQRKELFALLSTLLSPTFLASPKALELILPLMDKESPLPMLRPAGLHFLRALLASGGGAGLGWLKEEGGLEKVSEAAWRLPLGDDEQDIFVWAPKEDEEGETWIRGPGPVFVVLALGIYQQTLGMDARNANGIRSPTHLESTKRLWLTPLRTRLDERRRLRAARIAAEAEDEEDDDDEEEEESSGAWEAVEFALEGVEGALKGLKL